MTDVDKLLDQHESLYGEQMRLWDELAAESSQIDYTTFGLELVLLVFAIFCINRSTIMVVFFGAAGLVGMPILNRFWSSAVEHRYNRRDRELEAQKAELVKLIEASPTKPAHKWLVEEQFEAPPKRKWRKRKFMIGDYSPWPEHTYTYYW